ncbi:integral membrane pth11 [Fusarium albosuccineum]|uniref:Integral membrane pth11 n=1 Tax=Fusarium albosuccineum TaxID=1237068 RepID=A0A8H4LPV4_9HYPO|nr:integral membrane pth11 [Fusarium albosuccineum]
MWTDDIASGFYLAPGALVGNSTKGIDMSKNPGSLNEPTLLYRSEMVANERLSKQPELWAVEFITFAAATIFIALRLLSRRLTRIYLWWDDYFALCCYAMALGWVVIIPLWIDKGLGLHINNVKHMSKDEALFQTKLLLYIAELLYATALFFAKASILNFYWRMFRVTNIKLPIQILFTCSVIWIIIRTFMGIFHCIPVEAFWDSSAGGTCAIEDSKFFFGTILVHVIIDIAILILPIMQIRKLQLPTLQKLGVMVMFTFGILICVAAMVIIVASTQFDNTSEDMTWNLCTIVIWATVEVNLVTVSGSNSYGQNYGLSQTKKSIRLSTLPKGTEGDESSSTHQLAESDRGGRGSVSDFESHALDRYPGNTSTVVGQAHDGSSDDFPSSSGFGGIMVKNETLVRVSAVKQHR